MDKVGKLLTERVVLRLDPILNVGNSLRCKPAVVEHLVVNVHHMLVTSRHLYRVVGVLAALGAKFDEEQWEHPVTVVHEHGVSVEKPIVLLGPGVIPLHERADKCPFRLGEGRRSEAVVVVVQKLLASNRRADVVRPALVGRELQVSQAFLLDASQVEPRKALEEVRQVGHGQEKRRCNIALPGRTGGHEA